MILLYQYLLFDHPIFLFCFLQFLLAILLFIHFVGFMLLKVASMYFRLTTNLAQVAPLIAGCLSLIHLQEFLFEDCLFLSDDYSIYLFNYHLM